MNWLFGYSDHVEYRAKLSQASVRRLFVGFALVLVPLIAHTPLWALAATAALCFWRDRLHLRNQPVPSVSVRMALALIFVGGAAASIGTPVGREAGTVMVIGLTGIKFLELATVRDYMVLVFVLYLLLMLSLLFEQSLLVFIYVLAVFGVVTYLLVRLHVKDGEQGSWKPMAWRTGILVLQALPLAFVLFLIFPRVHGTFGFDLGLSKTGLSSTMEPGTVSKLIRETSTAFRVDFPNGEQPAAANLYWRALVHWRFNALSGRWSGRTDNRHLQEKPSLGAEPPMQQRITVYPHGKTWLFALDVPVPGSVSPSGIANTGSSLTLLSKQRKLIRKVQYEVTSRAGASSLLMNREEDEEALREEGTFIEHKDELDSGVQDIAHRLRGENRSDEEIVDAALQFFRKEGFEYTTQPPRYQNREGDPTSEFLLRGKRGFCEHFASAFAVLMRLNDIPTRVVAGYQGGERNPYGDFYIVRQSDAHAWNEVYLGEKGWVRVDPTLYVSPGRIIQGAEELIREQNPDTGLTVGGVRVLSSDWRPLWMTAVLDEGELRVQQVEEVWDRWVLSYNQDYQLELVRAAGFEGSEEEMFIGLLVLAVFLSLGLVYLAIRRGEVRSDPVSRVYSSYNTLLARQGVERFPWEGPLDYAARAATRLPHAGAAIEDFAEAYARIHYGIGVAGDAEAEVLRYRLVKVRTALKAKASRTTDASRS